MSAVVLILLLTPGACAAQSATVSGVVRDTHGIAQVGAMVQVLTAGSDSVRSTITDVYGRYQIANLVPGRYQVRATAALFVPAIRANLLLTMGTRATVNLTLGMLSNAATWIPAERRKPDEPGDDWTWTLRSTANRPILRMVDDPIAAGGHGEGVGRSPVLARAALVSGDGGFGEGGTRSVIVLDRVQADGSDAVLRGNLATAGKAPVAEVDAGYQHSAALGGATRVAVSCGSHPEVVTGGSAPGLQMMRVVSAETIRLGDFAEVEAGGTMYAVHAVGYALASRPFVRVTVHPNEVWAVRYRMATSRDVQGFDGLDRLAAELPVAALWDGRLQMESGTHQELAVSRKVGAGMVQAAVYRDVMARPAISGTGVLDAADMAGTADTSAAVADAMTGSFAFLAGGYTADGVSVTLSQPVATGLWAAVEYVSGAALQTRDGTPAPLAAEMAGLRPVSAQALTAALHSNVARVGTRIEASYRWQPQRVVTAVGPYEAFSDQGFLSFYVRQPLRWAGVLPPGLEATVDVTNLLAQGYQPFLSADGRTLFLAETQRTLQAGLSVTF